MAKHITIQQSNHLLNLPIYGTIAAGWPSPAEEELNDAITLDDYLIENRNSSFLLRVAGNSMKDAGIHPGDLVIVERGRTPKLGDIVVAEIDNNWTMKRLVKHQGKLMLEAANGKYPKLQPEEELTIHGVIRGVIRKYA